MTSKLTATEALKISNNNLKVPNDEIKKYAEEYLIELDKYINKKAEEGLKIFEIGIQTMHMKAEPYFLKYYDYDDFEIKQSLDIIVEDLKERRYNASYYKQRLRYRADNHYMLKVSWG